MQILIRAATARDASVLASVAAATFALACPPSTTPEAIADFIATQLSPERFEHYLADPSRALLLAEDEAGTVVGYAMAVLDEHPADAAVAAQLSGVPTAELSKLYVLPQAHGGGVAPALLAEVRRIAQAAGRRSLWLGTNQENLRAQRFYVKSGFVRVGTKQFLVGGKLEDDYIYELAL